MPVSTALGVRMRVPLSGLLLATAVSAAIANPRIEPLPLDSTSPASACRFYTEMSPKDRAAPVLVWAGSQAWIKVDGELLTLAASEDTCITNCVAPGRTGVRVVRLAGGVWHATLRAPSFCHEDAEACSGLPASRSHLTVAGGSGRTTLTVWNGDCDQ